jgi:hypothetical protein
MIRSFVLASLLLASTACISSAAGRNFGVGVVLGAPTGLSAKVWTSQTTAFDFLIGWSSGYRHGYYDSRCYDGGFYANNRGYCNGKAYDWRDYDGRYYGGRRGWRTLHVHSDYLFHNLTAIRSRERFALHYGPGINFEYFEYEEALVGIRGNFGISWLPRRAPMDVFLELAPVVNIFPDMFVDINLGLGSRFYF